jgi:hypothetical protein
MMRVYAAMAQKERELISERTKAALAAAKARGARLGGDRGYRPSAGFDGGAAAVSRRVAAERTAHRPVTGGGPTSGCWRHDHARFGACVKPKWNSDSATR